MIPWISRNSLPIGPLTIHLFGVLVATGILVGARWTHRRTQQLGLKVEDVSSMITWSLVFGFIISHIFDVFAYQTKGPNPTLWEILNPFGGLSSYGGFLGALVGLFAWAWRYKQPVLPYADGLGYGLSIGWMFGRLGCYTAHDHPGAFTNFWLSVRYPDGLRHDLGFDEAIWSAAVAAIFFVLGRKNRTPGLYVGLLSFLYGPFRFGLDFLRATDVPGADPRYFGLTPAQYGSLLVTVIGAQLLWGTYRRSKTSPPASA
jgi:phosphatidylglycerol:prolipoprotein diacylglycerol transferase